MNPQSSLTSNSLINLFKPRRNASGNSLQPAVRAVAEGSAVSTASDRMYQIAALTAGIFLLATLL